MLAFSINLKNFFLIEFQFKTHVDALQGYTVLKVKKNICSQQWFSSIFSLGKNRFRTKNSFNRQF